MSVPCTEAVPPITARLADIITFSSVDGPGNRFVVFLQGCNFDCISCHNPQTIPLSSHRPVTVDDVMTRLRRAAPFLSGVTVSGGEATLQAEFVGELFAAVKADPRLAHLTCFVDSNGATELATWDALGKLHEVRLLLHAGWNDDLDLMRRTGEWLAALDPAMRLKVIGARRHGTRPHDPAIEEPAPERLQAVVDMLHAVAPFDITVI